VSGTKAEQSVVAIVQEENRLRAVEVQRGPSGLRVAWAKSTEPGQLDWTKFAAECGVTVGRSQAAVADPARTQLAIGLGPPGVAFYRLHLPVVAEEETDAMVRMQAETRLPLSADQMELAWRIVERGEEQMTVTLAATRRKHIQALVDQVRPLSPDRLVLSCEALVKSWGTLFSESKPGNGVMVHMDGHGTQVCLVEDGQLSHMAVVDTGTEDLVGEHLGVPSKSEGQSGQTSVEEQFIQDLQAVLDGMKQPGQKQPWPVAVLSDGNPTLEYVAGLLRGAGFQVTIATPKAKTIQGDFSPGQWYEYKTALGLALMMIESPRAGLDLFMNLYRPPAEVQARTPVLSSRTALVVAAAALVGALLISFLTDLALDSRLKAQVEKHKIAEAKAQRDMRQVVAKYRPDILALLKEVNAGATEGGIMLDSLHFKRGQAVQILGQADRPEQLYSFEQALNKMEGLRSVKIDKQSQDTQTKKVKFTVSFQYKDFTQKGARS
jgi:hypothetical protein